MNNEWIVMVFRNGDICKYRPDEYTDYRYDGKYFIVIRDNKWIGFYNLDCISYVEIAEWKGEPQTDCQWK